MKAYRGQPSIFNAIKHKEIRAELEVKDVSDRKSVV